MVSIRHIAARPAVGVRRLLARHRWMRWIPVTACSCVLVIMIHRYTAEVDVARDAWLELRSVWVADLDIAAGDAVSADVVELPRLAVPHDAIPADQPVVGRRARQRVSRGEILTEHDVTGEGVASLIADGWRALAVTETTRSGATTGTVIDIVSDGVIVATDAVVIDELPDALLVSVPREVAPLVALAATSGVTILRTDRVGIPDG